MKLHHTILHITALFLFLSCQDNAPIQDDDSPTFFLKGVINQTDSLNFDYFEKENAPRGVSSSRTPSQTIANSYINAIQMNFGFDQNFRETIGINFQFKFDKTENLNLLSNISDLDHLEEMMINADWGYGENYTNTDDFIDVSYQSISYLADWKKYHTYNASDPSINSVKKFQITSIERYHHFANGDGLRVSGLFACVLYNIENQLDSMVMELEFKGFMQLNYCGKHQCE